MTARDNRKNHSSCDLYKNMVLSVCRKKDDDQEPSLECQKAQMWLQHCQLTTRFSSEHMRDLKNTKQMSFSGQTSQTSVNQKK